MNLGRRRIARDQLGWLLCVGCILALSGCENYRRSSMLFGKDQVCDPEQELTFLEVGDVVGHWSRVGASETQSQSFSFDKEGRFDYWYFGCEEGLWPLVENGLNSWESYMGYGWNSLEDFEIRPGYFRLDFLTQGHAETVEGKLMPDGSFHLKSTDAMGLNGVYFRSDEPGDEEESSTSGPDGSDDSLTSSDNSSTEIDSATTTQSGA